MLAVIKSLDGHKHYFPVVDETEDQVCYAFGIEWPSYSNDGSIFRRTLKCWALKPELYKKPVFLSTDIDELVGIRDFE